METTAATDRSTTRAPLIPPLLGDAEGKYRVLVLGNSGEFSQRSVRSAVAAVLNTTFLRKQALVRKVNLSLFHQDPGDNFALIACLSQSTTSREVASILGLPCISIDRLHWGPNWYSAPADELVENVRKALSETDGSWIIEGDYLHKLGTFVLDQTTDVICKFFSLAL